MARDYPKISPREHQEILQHEILRDPRRFLNASPVDRPRAVIMAGQPGAGKGGLVNIAKTQFDSNVVTIDVDDLRGYHPLVEFFRRRHPYTWSGHTHGDAAQWAAELRQAAVAQRKNLILDTTTPRVDIIRELQAAGYEVEVRALAAHRLESEVGVEERFTSQWDNEGHGRYVPKDVRDQVYRQLPDVLNDVARKTGVPVQVYDREGRLRFDSRQAWFRSPGMALRQGRFWRMWNHDRVVDLHKASQRQIGWHRSLTRRLDEGRVPPATASHLQNERAIVQVEEGLHRHGHHLAGHRVARISLRSAGLLGIAYGAFDAKTQVDDAIDAARSSREQWVRGGEEVANQAVKAVVTGGAAVVGAVPGVVAGALTSPATGPVGPVVGGLATGSATAIGAERVYEDSSLQRLTKAWGREAGELGYELLSQKGRQQRQVQDLADAAAPAESTFRLTLEQARHLQLARELLGPGLRAHGHAAGDIERVAAAVVYRAQVHDHQGPVRALHLSKDGADILVVQDGFPRDVFSVRQALTRTVKEHLEHAQDVASEQQEGREQRAQATSLQPEEFVTRRNR